MGGIIAAALHAQDDNPSYLLGGLIFSALGEQLLPEMKENPVPTPKVPPGYYWLPVNVKDSLMFRPRTVHPDMLKLSERLNCSSPVSEIESLRTSWLPVWRDEWAPHGGACDV